MISLIYMDKNNGRFVFYVYNGKDENVLYLPAALTRIEEEAFAGVDASMIVLPGGVESVADRAFADCPNLVVVVSPVGIPEAPSRAARTRLL